jgi:ferredoxin
VNTTGLASTGAGAAAWRRLDHGFDAVFGAGASPLRHLGALGVTCGALLAASGAWLYAVLDTSAAEAWRSIAEHGGWPRSLHRYAADALVALMSLHALREALLHRTRGFRRWSWLSGVVLIALVYASGIGGFWLHWDRLGQYSAQATAEWLDALPLLHTPLARNFIGAASVGDRLFSLFVFVHIGLALLIGLTLWLHVLRLAQPAVWPPRRLAAGLVLTLGALALAWPVAVDEAARPAQAPTTLALDWWLLFIHPLAERAGPLAAWALVAAGFAALVALAFVPRRAAPVAAQVDAGNCNGCRRCETDCPFVAITMVPHPLRVGRQLAQVDAARCAGCGLCAGACPSATPFRHGAALASGIDLPGADVAGLRQRLRAGLAAARGSPPVAIFHCAEGADPGPLRGQGVVLLALPCIGALPPSFVEYALRDGAAGVLLAGCRSGGCAYRLGERWTAERLAGRREPHLRTEGLAGRWAAVAADRGDEAAVLAALGRLRAAPTPQRAAAEGDHG